jgi:ACR3 family arsenite transporter
MKQLSFLDKTLSLWILLAIVFGTLVGVYVPSVRSVLNTSEVEHVSIPVFVGLLLMLYPVFCKVKYEDWFLSRDLKNWKFVVLSIVLNWIICPFVMAALAWATLPDLPDYRTGVLLIGIARVRLHF